MGGMETAGWQDPRGGVLDQRVRKEAMCGTERGRGVEGLRQGCGWRGAAFPSRLAWE